MIAAVSALVLLILMFISWFSLGASDEVKESLAAAAGQFDVDETIGYSAWESFSFIDIILFITIIVAIGVAVMSANAQSGRPSRRRQRHRRRRSGSCRSC